MTDNPIFTVSLQHAGMRLDHFLREKFPEHTRSYLHKRIKSGDICVNNAAVKSGYTLKEGDRVSVLFPEEESIQMKAEAIPLKIVYEDDHIIVVNKPAGLVVHPGRGTPDHTLVNALLYHTKALSETDATERPGIVHRLDKDTSGLLVIAKTNRAHAHLRKQFDRKTINRVYEALVWGKLKQQTGTVETFIDRSRRDPTKMRVTRSGRRAVTHYRLIQDFEYVSLLELTLETGRTHQIRVHLSHIHHPVVGDPDYNGRHSQLGRLPHNLKRRGEHMLNMLERQALHAHRLRFIHPQSGQTVVFEAPLPSDFDAVLQKLPDLFMLPPSISGNQ